MSYNGYQESVKLVKKMKERAMEMTRVKKAESESVLKITLVCYCCDGLMVEVGPSETPLNIFYHQVKLRSPTYIVCTYSHPV